jgi:hypothetical protein
MPLPCLKIKRQLCPYFYHKFFQIATKIALACGDPSGSGFPQIFYLREKGDGVQLEYKFEFFCYCGLRQSKNGGR